MIPADDYFEEFLSKVFSGECDAATLTTFRGIISQNAELRNRYEAEAGVHWLLVWKGRETAGTAVCARRPARWRWAVAAAAAAVLVAGGVVLFGGMYAPERSPAAEPLVAQALSPVPQRETEPVLPPPPQEPAAAEPPAPLPEPKPAPAPEKVSAQPRAEEIASLRVEKQQERIHDMTRKQLAENAVRAVTLAAAVTVSGIQTAAASVLAPGLDGWLDLPFGTYNASVPGTTVIEAPAGSTVEGTVWKMTDSGSNMYGANADGGRYVFRPLHGDGEVLARVYRNNGWTNNHGRAGVMVRENLRNDSSTSIFYRFRLTEGYGEGESIVRGQYRSDPGATMQWQWPIVSNLSNEYAFCTNDWVWVRIVRHGSTFAQFFASNDAPASTDWVPYNSCTAAMAEDANAGFFASRYPFAKYTSAIGTNWFTSVAVNTFVTPTNTENAIDVTWVSAPAVTNAYSGFTYTVSRGSSYSGPFTELTSGLTETHYLDESIEKGRTYYYRVDALCDNTDTNLIGVSGAARLPAASTNLVSSWPQGYWYTQWSLDTPYNIISNGVFGSAIYPHSVSNHVVVYFGMLYSATLVPEATDDYYFMNSMDNGSKTILWVGETQLFTNVMATATYFGPVHLEAGKAVPLRVLYLAAYNYNPLLYLQWGRLSTGEFTEIPVERVSPMPPEWSGYDFGPPAQNGMAVFDPATSNITVTAGGSAADVPEAGHFLSQLKSGSCGLVTSFTLPEGNAKAGLLLRQSLDMDAAFIACYAATNGLQIECRASADTNAVVTPCGLTLEAGSTIWLKMVSDGATAGFYYKTSSGSSWTLLTNAAFTASSTVYEGLAVQSVSDTEGASVTFRDTHDAELFVRVPPRDDAFIRGWSDGNTNSVFGTWPSLHIKNFGVNDIRHVLLKFDTAGFETLKSAKLRLYVSDKATIPQATNEVLYVCRFADTSWAEETTSWGTLAATQRLPLPFLDDSFDSRFIAKVTVPAKGEFMEVDVTDAVRKSAAEGGVLSLGIYTTAGYNSTVLSFASKEEKTETLLDKRPYLVCSDFGAVGLSAAPGANSSEIALTWRFAQDDVKYSILRATGSDGPFSIIARNVTGYTYYDTGLVSGTRYYYRVVQTGTEADSAIAATVSSLPDASAHGTLSPVVDTYVLRENIFAVANTWGNLVLKSGFSTGLQREIIMLFNIAGLANVQNARLRLTSTTPSNDGGGNVGSAKTVEPVYFNIEAQDFGDWSGRAGSICWSNSPAGDGVAWTLRKQEKDWPDQRTIVRARLAGFTGVQQEIDITQLIRSAAQKSNWMTLVMYRVDTVNNDNCLFYSKEDGTVSRRPLLLYSVDNSGIGDTCVAAAGDGLLVSWPTVTNALSYQVSRAASADGEYAVLATGVKATNMVDRTVSPGQTYFYHVRAVTASGLTEAATPACGTFAPQMQRLLPLADTFIDAGANAQWSINYLASQMNTKRRYGPTREVLFRFNVAGLEKVGSAVFRFCTTAYDVNYQMGGLVVYDLSSTADAWDETRVCWGNAPLGIDQDFGNSATRGTNELGRIKILTYSSQLDQFFHEVDATEAVRKAAAAGHDLVLKVGGDATIPDPQGKDYFATDSKERGYDICRPGIYYTPSSASSGSIATDQNAGGRAVTLSWRDVAGAQSYTLTRTDSKGVVTTLLANAASTSVVDTNLWNAAKYSYTYSLIANYPKGESVLLATNTVHMGNTFTRYAVADSYLFTTNKAQLTEVRGTEQMLGIKFVGANIIEFTREAYLRFDVSNLPSIKKALLRLTVADINEDKQYNLVADSVEDTGWTETGDNALTWATSGLTVPTIAPTTRAANEAVNRVPVANLVPGSTVEFDITPLVISAVSQKKGTLVIHIYSDTAGNTKNLNLWSSDRSSRSLQPQILYTVPSIPSQGTVVMLM